MHQCLVVNAWLQLLVGCVLPLIINSQLERRLRRAFRWQQVLRFDAAQRARQEGQPAGTWAPLPSLPEEPQPCEEHPCMPPRLHIGGDLALASLLVWHAVALAFGA